jgi:phosphate transport system permease protein
VSGQVPKPWPEKIYEKILLVSAFFAVISITLIGLFVFLKGYPVLQQTGLKAFVFGSRWAPTQGVFGIFPMVVGSLAVTLGALILGVPLALATAIFLAEFAPAWVARLVRPAIELLAGIPSVVYGLFGLILIVPLIRKLEVSFLGEVVDPQLQVGYSVLAVAIILAIMILPTIINIAEDAIHAVPRDYREGSYALGATQWQTITRVVIPAARSGIIAGVVLGMGRAIGETMAVIMVAGNTTLFPRSFFSPVRTLTGNIAIESAYASGLHEQALFANGIILFLFIFILTAFAWFVRRRVRS